MTPFRGIWWRRRKPTLKLSTAPEHQNLWEIRADIATPTMTVKLTRPVQCTEDEIALHVENFCCRLTAEGWPVDPAKVYPLRLVVTA